MLAAVLFFVLVLLTPLQLEAKFKSLHCTNYDRSYGEILLCKIKAINRYRNSISIQFRQLRTVNNVHVSKTLDLGFPPKLISLCLSLDAFGAFKRANGWRPFLYNISFNLCDFLSKRNNVIVSLGYEYLKPYIPMTNYTCPFKVNAF